MFIFAENLNMGTIFDQIEEQRVDVSRCIFSDEHLLPEYISTDEPWEFYQKISEEEFTNLIVFIVTLKRYSYVTATEEDYNIVKKITEMLNDILCASRIRYSNINVSSFFEYIVDSQKYDDTHYGKVGVQFEQRVKTTLQLSHRSPSNYMFYFKFGADFTNTKVFTILNFFGRLEQFCYYCDKLNPGMSRSIIEMYHRPKFDSIFPYRCESRINPTIQFRFNAHHVYPKQIYDKENVKSYIWKLLKDNRICEHLPEGILKYKVSRWVNRFIKTHD